MSNCYFLNSGSPWYSLAKPSGGPPYVTGMPERPERPEMMPKPQGLIRKPKNYTPHILSPNTEATESKKILFLGK